MANQSGHGGARKGSGRNQVLSPEQDFIAWHRYGLLVQKKAVHRASIDFYGSEIFNNDSYEEDNVDRYLSEMKLLPVKEREEFLKSESGIELRLNIKTCFEAREKRYIATEGDDLRLISYGVQIGNARGRLREDEPTQDDMFREIAVSMTRDLGKHITPNAVREAVKRESKRRRKLENDEIIERFKLLI